MAVRGAYVSANYAALAMVLRLVGVGVGFGGVHRAARVFTRRVDRIKLERAVAGARKEGNVERCTIPAGVAFVLDDRIVRVGSNHLIIALCCV